ncbi:MAG: asparagine synthase-related protein [Caldilineaceae bacterium]
MPGIVGFQGPLDATASTALMRSLLRALDPDAVAGDADPRNNGTGSHPYIDCFATANLGLGRVHLGIIDKQPQPLWSADHSVALVMAGEIFSWDGLNLERPLTGREPDFSNAALLLAAYMQLGEAFVDHVNGTFVAAIWNATEQTLLLVTDHIGSYPLYYAQVGDMLVFGSGARVAAQAPGLPRVVNTAAIAEMVTCEHLYGDNTFFGGVRLLLPGTILRFQDGTLSQTRYIDFQYPEQYEYHDEVYYLDSLMDATRTAVLRQARGPAPLGVLLSGGLDSRTILGMLAGSGTDVETYTFGLPGCDDEHSARAMARVLRLPHRFLPLAPDYLAHYAAKGVHITDGQKSVVHFQAGGAIENVDLGSRILFKGLLGGTIHGDVVSRERLAPYGDADMFEQAFRAHNRVFYEDHLSQLYTPQMFQEVRDVPRQSLRDALARSRSTWWVDKLSYVDLYQEDVRFTVMGVELTRARALVRSPLADKDLVRTAALVPPGLRADKVYYRQAIARALPQLAQIDYARTRRPVTDGCFRDIRLRAQELARYWLRNHGASWVPLAQPRPYADYGAWMRRELRPWVEATLLSRQSLDRGYFAPSYIRNLVAEHMAGCDHARRLGTLLTIELWHRQFID